MEAKRIDRNWMRDATDEARADTRTRRALERIVDEKQQRTRELLIETKRRRMRVLQNPVTLEKHFSTAYWADLLGFTEDTISDLCRSDKIKAEKICGEWRITATAVREFIMSQRARRGA